MHTTYLPSIFGDPQGDWGCGMNAQAKTFVRAWLSLLGDKGAEMRCDPRLVAAAQAHADYLHARTEAEILARAHIPHASHYGADWSMSNDRARAHGYPLPDNYLPLHNNLESITRHFDTPTQAARALYDHDTHHDHMALVGGFAHQVIYGVGATGHDYVVLTAPPA
jgi:hypothetical protein